ncbi:MAG: tRNA (guanosine(37)-N1)-methyltransferase TrmD [Corynebacterium sp.]|nr:tRNA (guanosine(37)-N1)-methyltransferase TrmD [Corynebacterium sp.]
MRIDIITIFPGYVEPLGQALVGKALEQDIVSIHVHNLRDWAVGAHKSVDDSPYGGGPGMIMLPQVWGQALDAVAAGEAGHVLATAESHLTTPRHDEVAGVEFTGYGAEEEHSLPLLVVPSPAGTPFTQAMARQWSQEERIVFACGRYEGIDARVFVDAAKRYRVQEVSIGDYVLIGGEVAAMAITEAVVRLIPGVLGNSQSHAEDSFSDGLIEGPQYTKPREWRGLAVPKVLMSGDHKKVAQWHREQAIATTARVRPELYEQLCRDGVIAPGEAPTRAR